MVEGCKKERNMNGIVAKPAWKYDTQKCVDASPLVVYDGSEIVTTLSICCSELMLYCIDANDEKFSCIIELPIPVNFYN